MARGGMAREGGRFIAFQCVFQSHFAASGDGALRGRSMGLFSLSQNFIFFAQFTEGNGFSLRTGPTEIAFYLRCLQWGDWKPVMDEVSVDPVYL